MMPPCIESYNEHRRLFLEFTWPWELSIWAQPTVGSKHPSLYYASEQFFIQKSWNVSKLFLGNPTRIVSEGSLIPPHSVNSSTGAGSQFVTLLNISSHFHLPMLCLAKISPGAWRENFPKAFATVQLQRKRLESSLIVSWAVKSKSI